MTLGKCIVAGGHWTRRLADLVCVANAPDDIAQSLSAVVPSHLVDRASFGFTDLKTDGVANPLGDIAFDEEPCATGQQGSNWRRSIGVPRLVVWR
jgi:hypothetical protein